MGSLQAVTNDMRVSMDSVRKHSDVIKRLIHCTEIMPVEGDNHEVLQILDMTCGVDYYAKNSEGIVFAVASRFQKYCAWNTFTIRAKRESGAKTEYEKRTAAIKRGAEYPHLTMQGYVDMDGELESLAIARTEDILECIENGNYYTQHTRSDKDGQALFYVVSWDTMKQLGYHVNRYQRDGVNKS